MKSAILVGCALLTGCASPPPAVEVKGDVIPLDAAPMASELSIKHHRFLDNVIPGARVDRSGYTPSIMIGDPTLRVPPVADARDIDQDRKSRRIAFEDGQTKGAGESGICPSAERNCVLAELFFGLDQSDITPVSQSILSNIDVAGKSLELIGYADAVGENNYNGKLALARAQNVQKALIKSGAKEVVVRAGHEAQFAGPKFRKVIIVGL